MQFQHLEKLHELEQLLSANTSELIASAIDHVFSFLCSSGMIR